MTLSVNELQSLSARFDPSPHKSFSLPAKTYLEKEYLGLERKEMFQKSWQYVCHIEALKEVGQYITIDIQGQPIVAIRDDKGDLRAFYNVCRHKAHELLTLVSCLYKSKNFAA